MYQVLDLDDSTQVYRFLVQIYLVKIHGKLKLTA